VWEKGDKITLIVGLPAVLKRLFADLDSLDSAEVDRRTVVGLKSSLGRKWLAAVMARARRSLVNGGEEVSINIDPNSYDTSSLNIHPHPLKHYSYQRVDSVMLAVGDSAARAYFVNNLGLNTGLSTATKAIQLVLDWNLRGGPVEREVLGLQSRLVREYKFQRDYVIEQQRMMLEPLEEGDVGRVARERRCAHLGRLTTETGDGYSPYYRVVRLSSEDSVVGKRSSDTCGDLMVIVRRDREDVMKVKIEIDAQGMIRVLETRKGLDKDKGYTALLEMVTDALKVAEGEWMAGDTRTRHRDEL